MKIDPPTAPIPHEDDNTGVHPNTIIGFVILGFFVAGLIALAKAYTAVTGVDVLLCVCGALLSFGAVAWFYYGRK